MVERISGIIWDWNGTILNDMELCVETMNELLTKRKLPLLDIIHYKQVFSFPVKAYYEKIGFNFELEPFEIPALEFIDRYNERMKTCSLHKDSLNVLTYFQSLGIRQFVLSAMKQDALDDCLNHFNLSWFFERASGLDNHYAVSKIENGKQLIEEFNLNPGELVLIGDTIHDFEVATQLGCRCVLIANGHQHKEILQTTGVQVIDRVAELLS